MNSFRITFANGNSLVTRFNGEKEEALTYYLGRYFELTEDDFVKCVKVEMQIGGFGWCEIVK